MALKTYLYSPTGITDADLAPLLASGASPSVGAASNIVLLPVTVDEANKDDLDEAMAVFGYGFIVELVSDPAPGSGRDYGVRAAEPTEPPPAAGDFYFNTADEGWRIHDGISFFKVPVANGSDQLADSWISSSSITQHDGSIDHDALLNYVVAQHRIINDSGAGTTELWSASKISAEVGAAQGNSDLKDSVETASTTNLVLSGEQTINGVLTSSSRVGAVGQTLGEESGLYISAAGAWARSPDADTDAEVNQGMTFFVADGTLKGNQYILTTPNPIDLGTTPLSFTEIPRIELGTTAGTAAEGNDPRIPSQDENDALVGESGTPSTANTYLTEASATASATADKVVRADGSAKVDTWVSDASTTTRGKLELATQPEVNAGVDASRALTPATLKNTTLPFTPTNHAASHKHGGSDEVSTATPGANEIPKADGSGKLDTWISDATTSAKGKVELASDREDAAGVVVQGNDARLDPFVGDSGSGGQAGLVPAPAAGDAASGKFVKADGTFAVPPGGGGGMPRDTFNFRVNGKPVPSASVDGAWIAPRAGTFERITLWRGTAGNAGSTIIDVNKNAVTIYTTQANRPTVLQSAGDNAIDTKTPDITTFAQDDRIEVDIDSVETGNPQDLSVTIEAKYT